MSFNPKEYKIICLRECPTPEQMQLCDTPDKIPAYYWSSIINHPYHNPEVECFYVVLLNPRRRIKGHFLVSTGTADSVFTHPREVFRGAIIASAAAVILVHNHPSGDPAPSEADIKTTRDLIRGGQLLKIEVLDHIIMGTKSEHNDNRGFCSLRELGYFSI